MKKQRLSRKRNKLTEIAKKQAKKTPNFKLGRKVRS